MNKANTKNTFSNHVLELRKRLIISIITILISGIITFIFHKDILEFLLNPPNGLTYFQNTKPIYTELTEYISVAIKVSIYTGILISSPIIFLQIILFLSPGLKKNEKMFLYLSIPIIYVTFSLGLIFGLYVLFPPAIRFLITFGSDIATPYIRIGNYISILISLLGWMGLIFQTPLIMFILGKLKIINSIKIKRFRRYFWVVSFVLGAIITPTFDPINQTLVAIPIILLYEIGFILVWIINRGTKEK
jgi:sec-independent protein translocase protein TatC